MPFELGGIADKLGNRYEGRWLATQFLSLLNEKIFSVTVEAIGDDERGVDIWIVQKNGVRQAHQCKARNGSKDHWDLGDLASRGVLSNLKYQLDRDPGHEFFFVSSVGSEVLQSICNFARRSEDNSELFHQEKILKGGKDVKKGFVKFCDHLSLKSDEESDRAKAFRYLKRTYITVYPDDHGAWHNLLDRADSLILGSPHLVVSTLLNYAVNNDRLGRPIYADELRKFLAGNGLHPKQLEHDSRIAPVVEVLQREFAESIRPQLIGGGPINRSETSLLIDAINSGQNVVLSGTAGYGKSGVLYELTTFLQQEKIPYLPIRLDRREPANTAAQFGQQMGLPDCPVFSLAALAGERKSVLILDQLDAIRWTSAHSDNALDVCKELEHHVQLKRLEGDKISIVLCCRTFDLEHDPAIRNWLGDKGDQGFTRVEVKKLSPEILQKLVGASFLQMTEKERSLLASPLNLSIWLALNQTGPVPRFRTATDLMREFWKNRRLVLQEKAGVTPEQIEQVLSPLIDYMEKNGKISAPERVVEKWPRLTQTFFSYGILQQSADRISFCHQRYLDFLIAGRLLEQIDSGTGSVLEWLGPKKRQSLFRREQLRQALVMLAEESPSDFLSSAEQILAAKEIRFHIKHLVLELVGSLEDVPEEIGEYCLLLLDDKFWQEHILETVFASHPPHVSLLYDKGIIGQWLDSKAEDIVNRALWLLRSVADQIPDIVAEALSPHLKEENPWPERILNSIAWNTDDDSERMFQLRLELARRKIVGRFINWETVCKKHPFRALQLIEAVLSSWKIDEALETSEKRSRLERWYDKDKEALENVVKEIPQETWDYFLPHIERLTLFKADHLDARQEEWREARFPDSRSTMLGRGVVELALLAGQKLAENHPSILMERTCRLEASTSPIIQEILIETYRYLPSRHADHAIEWLLADTARLRLGSGINEPEWKPAERLIAALSPFCSDALFRQLEEVIIHYHDPEEKREAKYWLTTWKEGYFGHYWGKTQYLLLPALSEERRSPTVNALIQVLRRKFTNYSEDRFLRIGRSQGGWVGSKLDPNLERISDRAWLKIVCNSKVEKPNRRDWIQVSPDRVLETSIRQFSSSLQTIAKRYPERFARLALRFPIDVDPAYISAILDACGQRTPDATLPDEVKKSWKPATVTMVETLLEKFQGGDDRETAMSFCRLITERHEEKWSNTTLARLIHYAKSHPDLAPGKLNVYCDKSADEASVDTLFQNTINCVRGVAACAIKLLLWEHQNLLETLRPGIESLVRDHHPAIRMAAAEMLLPVLNIDKDLAVEWYVIACEEDLRVAASPRGAQFYNYTIPSHIDSIGPIIQKIVLSPWDDVAEEGARQVTARWLFHGFFEKELLVCQTGTIPQRQGVAEDAVQLLHNHLYSEACQKILRPLLNDPAKEVRDKLRHPLYNHPNTLNDVEFRPFILEYINSQTFADDPSMFVWHIKNDYTGSLIFLADTIFKMCEVFSSNMREKSGNTGGSIAHDISETASFLLRLYEQALAEKKHEIAERCLDIWDEFFQNRVGIARTLTEAIEN